MGKTTNKGQCLCGEVTFEVMGPLRDVTFCHCKQCRAWHGNFVGYTVSEDADFQLTKSASLKWYISSDQAKRGFCINCGSSLFWKHNDLTRIGIAAGCLEDPTGLSSAEHIFVNSAADYYPLQDGLPQFEGDH